MKEDLATQHVCRHSLCKITDNTATTHRSNIAGEGVIMEQVELMKHKVEMKLLECARDTPLRLCGLVQANCSQLRIWEYIVRCSLQLLRIFTGHVWQESDVRNIDVRINKDHICPIVFKLIHQTHKK